VEFDVRLQAGGRYFPLPHNIQTCSRATYATDTGMGGGGFSPQTEAVLEGESSGEVNHRVELHLSGSWLSK